MALTIFELVFVKLLFFRKPSKLIRAILIRSKNLKQSMKDGIQSNCMQSRNRDICHYINRLVVSMQLNVFYLCLFYKKLISLALK